MQLVGEIYFIKKLAMITLVNLVTLIEIYRKKNLNSKIISSRLRIFNFLY